MGFFDSLLGGFASALPGSLLSSVGGIFTNKANRDFQREMWQEEKEYNTSERLAAQEYNTSERIDAQQYNSPVNQYARLLATGINPNAAMQSISGVASQPQSISAQSGSPSFTDQVNPLGSLADIGLVAAQSAKLQAETKAQQIDNATKDEMNRLTIDQQKRAIGLADAQIKSTGAAAGLSQAQMEQIQMLTPLLVSKTQVEIGQLQQAIETSKAEMKLKGEQAKTEQWKNNLRQLGVDVDSSVLDNIFRIMVTESPETADRMIDTLFDSVGSAISSLLKNLKPTLPKLPDLPSLPKFDWDMLPKLHL